MGIFDRFAVGDRLQAKMKKTFNEDLIVDLGDNIFGRVNGGAKEVIFEEGKEVSLVVDSILENMIILCIDKGQDATSINSEEAWCGWLLKPEGHTTSLNALMELLKCSDAFQRDLIQERNELKKKIANHQKTFEEEKVGLERDFKEKTQQYLDECNREIAYVESHNLIGNGVLPICDTYLDKYPQKDPEIARRVRDNISNKVNEYEAEIQRIIQAHKDLRDCRIAQVERTMNEQLDRITEEKLEKNRQTERQYVNRIKTLKENFQRDVGYGFSKSGVNAYSRTINNSRFNAMNYECPAELPEYVMLGSIEAMFLNSTEDENNVVQSIDVQTADFSVSSDSNYIVKIPYVQRLSEGISLFMEYTNDFGRQYAQKQIVQSLLLKLFMSLPAGKLEATMIDPLDIGSNFTVFPKLFVGPNTSKFMDTKIWSSEKEIESAISRLRMQIEDITQSYGDDKVGRFKKEAIKALAITDFPSGFSDAALRDLHTIVRNSASTGVCVFICANLNELDKLKDKNEALLKEIASCLVQTTVSGDKLLFNNTDRRIRLNIDSMEDVEEHKEEILSVLRIAIERVPINIEPFSAMFNFDIYDSNNWFMGEHQEISVPIGIKGADTIVNMVLGRGGGSTEHHVLVAGPTGAGKSNFFHTLIMSTLISYSPDEVQMYLLDFKEGVEFHDYTKYRLPSLRAVAIKSEREFGLTILEELCSELEYRARMFNHYDVSDIYSYSELTGVPKIPKLLLIFDEVQELFRKRDSNDDISSKCLSCINRLVMQGRSMGIHIILACQDFRNCSGLEAYFSQMVVRVVISGSVDAASSILNSDNKEISTIAKKSAGAAIYNSGAGVEAANNIFQISYCSENERKELLERFDEFFSDPAVAEVYKNYQTKVLFSNAADNRNICFNRLIVTGPNSVERIGTEKDAYGLLLGMSFGKKHFLIPELARKDRENLLIVTSEFNETVAIGMFELAMMSVLYEELSTNNDKSNLLAYIVDVSKSDVLNYDQCDFEYFAEQFNNQVTLVKKRDIEDLINDLYENLVGRMDGTIDASERVFLMFFGINRVKNILVAGMYDNEDGIDTMTKLQEIVKKGPKYGINSIVWGVSIDSVEDVFTNRWVSMFNKRIALGLDEESTKILVQETQFSLLRGTTAAYMDIYDETNTHFKPFDVPTKEWIKEYSEAYKKAIGEGGN